MLAGIKTVRNSVHEPLLCTSKKEDAIILYSKDPQDRATKAVRCTDAVLFTGLIPSPVFFLIPMGVVYVNVS